MSNIGAYSNNVAAPPECVYKPACSPTRDVIAKSYRLTSSLKHCSKVKHSPKSYFLLQSP